MGRNVANPPDFPYHTTSTTPTFHTTLPAPATYYPRHPAANNMPAPSYARPPPSSSYGISPSSAPVNFFANGPSRPSSYFYSPSANYSPAIPPATFTSYSYQPQQAFVLSQCPQHPLQPVPLYSSQPTETFMGSAKHPQYPNQLPRPSIILSCGYQGQSSYIMEHSTGTVFKTATGPPPQQLSTTFGSGAPVPAAQVSQPVAAKKASTIYPIENIPRPGDLNRRTFASPESIYERSSDKVTTKRVVIKQENVPVTTEDAPLMIEQEEDRVMIQPEEDNLEPTDSYCGSVEGMSAPGPAEQNRHSAAPRRDDDRSSTHQPGASPAQELDFDCDPSVSPKVLELIIEQWKKRYGEYGAYLPQQGATAEILSVAFDVVKKEVCGGDEALARKRFVSNSIEESESRPKGQSYSESRVAFLRQRVRELQTLKNIQDEKIKVLKQAILSCERGMQQPITQHMQEGPSRPMSKF